MCLSIRSFSGGFLGSQPSDGPLCPGDGPACARPKSPYCTPSTLCEATIWRDISVPTGESEPSPIPYVPSVARLRDQEEEHLQDFAREQFPDIKCRAIMEDGDPATIIDGVAQRDGIDLIMMPTRGLGTFRRLLLGSATAKVLHDVSCAVFTTRPRS